MFSDGDFVTMDDVLEAVTRATTKICDDDDNAPPPSWSGPMAGGMQYGGGSVGAGFPS